MKLLNLAQPDPSLVAAMRITAARMNYDGRQSPAGWRHIKRCTRYHRPTQAMLAYTRDSGMHSSGWWKNPGYERCLHLSVSFLVYGEVRPHHLPQDHRMAAKWCKAFFGDNVKLLWIEPPFTPEGKQRDVYHYRLFCDASWQPIKPRGEVYSRDWTPEGWKSWSDLHGYDNGDGDFGGRNGPDQ